MEMYDASVEIVENAYVLTSQKSEVLYLVLYPLLHPELDPYPISKSYGSLHPQHHELVMVDIF